MMSQMGEAVKEILKGSVDFHIHSHLSPDYYWNLVDIGSQAASIGLRALVIKNLYGSSHEQCHMANKILGQDMLYASLVLGHVTGGMNPAAVRQFAQFGGTNRILEMPVFDAAHHVRLSGKPTHSGIAVIGQGKPAPGIMEILEIAARNDLVLKTGHISPEESIALVQLAKEAGVRKVVVTHATGAPVMASIEQQRKMAERGALIEHCLAKFLPISVWRNTKNLVEYESGTRLGDLQYLEESIRSVGPARCILSTDSGQVSKSYPHEQLKYFVYLVLEMGFSHEEVRWMVRDNPRNILGIED